MQNQQNNFGDALEGHFPLEEPETARWSGEHDRFNPRDEPGGPAGNAVAAQQNLQCTVDIRDGGAVVTWEGGGPHLTFRISTGGAEVTFLAGTAVLRQLKQMLSWADDRPALAPGSIPNGRPALPPETYRG